MRHLLECSWDHVAVAAGALVLDNHAELANLRNVIITIQKNKACVR